MTSSQARPPNQITHDHQWQTLIEFTLSSQSESIHLATDLVLGTVQTLNCPAAQLEQLKLALVKAIQNALERSQLNGLEASLIIRVLIPAGSQATQAAHRVSDEPSQGQASARAAQQVSRPPSRGWGFFLVQKPEDNPQASAGESYYLIELFLYQERKQSQKQ